MCVIMRNSALECTSMNKSVQVHIFENSITGWTVGSKTVGRNNVFTLKPEYYHKTENQQAEMTIRPKNIFFIALVLTVYYMTEYYFRPYGIFGLMVFGLPAEYFGLIVFTFSVYWFQSYGPVAVPSKKANVYYCTIWYLANTLKISTCLISVQYSDPKTSCLIFIFRRKVPIEG